jgi:hypothetical protein
LTKRTIIQLLNSVGQILCRAGNLLSVFLDEATKIQHVSSLWVFKACLEHQEERKGLEWLMDYLSSFHINGS